MKCRNRLFAFETQEWQSVGGSQSRDRSVDEAELHRFKLPIAITLGAITGNDVWAVGTSSHALAEHWDGAQWTLVAAPNAGAANNVLKAASGTAADDVWQVVYAVFGTERRTLIQHWDGNAWAIVPSPNTTKRLNEAIKRNRSRFPADFAFQLTVAERSNLRSQFATSSLQSVDSLRKEGNWSQFATSSYGGRRYVPWAFTEHGALMAATILRSERAVHMSIYVIRAFVRLREQVGGDGRRIGRFVRNHHQFRWPGQQVNSDYPGDQMLRGGYPAVSRPDDDIDRFEWSGTKGQRGNSLRPADGQELLGPGDVRCRQGDRCRTRRSNHDRLDSRDASGHRSHQDGGRKREPPARRVAARSRHRYQRETSLAPFDCQRSRVQAVALELGEPANPGGTPFQQLADLDRL